MKPKYLQIKDELAEIEEHKNALIKTMRKLCPHKDIVRDSYCNDDWAQHKEYTAWYTCQICHETASFDEEKKETPSDLYKKLDKLYWEQYYAKAYK